MQKISTLKMKGKLAQNSSSSTTFSTPKCILSQRATHISNQLLHQSLNNFSRLKMQDQIQQISKNANFVRQKSLILFKYDKKIDQFINKHKPFNKQANKMKIFSMRKVKLKLNQKMTSSKKLLPVKSNYEFSINFNFNSFRRSKQRSEQTTPSTIPVNRRTAGLHIQTSYIASFRQYLKMMMSKYHNIPKKRKSQLLIDQMIKYLQKADHIQLQKDLFQIQSIAQQMIICLTSPQESLPVNIFRMINRDLTKLFFNIFYQIYRKKQKKMNYLQFIRINKQIQYASRKLNIFPIALRTCFDLGKIHCDKFQYDKAFQQYSNAIKLSVYMKNTFYQQIAIDKLGLCKYYLGDSTSALYFHNNLNNLSQYDLNRIRQQYSNQHEIQRLIEQKKQLTNSINFINKQALKKKLRRADSQTKQKKDLVNTNENQNNQSDKIDIGEFTFDKQNRQQRYPYFNQIQFKSNLKEIIKIPQLRQKIHIIKKNLKKNDEIGIKKYFGDVYIIPKIDTSAARKQANYHQNNSIFISHRSYNRKNVQFQTEKLQKQTQFLVNILVFFRDNQIFNKKQIQLSKNVSNQSFKDIQN